MQSAKVQAGCKDTINEYYTFIRLRFKRDVKALLVSTIRSLVSVQAGCKGTINEYYDHEDLRFSRDVKALLLSTIRSLT